MREGVLHGERGGGEVRTDVLVVVKLPTQPKYQNMNFTRKVRTIWLVLTISKGLVEG